MLRWEKFEEVSLKFRSIFTTFVVFLGIHVAKYFVNMVFVHWCVDELFLFLFRSFLPAAVPKTQFLSHFQKMSDIQIISTDILEFFKLDDQASVDGLLQLRELFPGVSDSDLA